MTTSYRRSRSRLVVASLLVTGCSSIFGDLFEENGLKHCVEDPRFCVDASVSSRRPHSLRDAGAFPDAALPPRSKPQPVNDASGIPEAGGGFINTGAGDVGGGATGNVNQGGTDHNADTSSDASPISDASFDVNDAGAAPEAGPGEGPPSCAHLEHTCGLAADDDCCASILVPGGPFQLGYDVATDSGATAEDSLAKPEHAIVLTPYYLDQYEVTLGRFRQFVDRYDAWRKPLPGDGAYPGRPVNSGWQKEWATELPTSSAVLKANVYCTVSGDPVWTDVPLRNETRAMNCLDWYTAYAFCIWDGGRLPTEAEWEFAAAGGQEKRNYPWGDTWNPNYLNYANEYHVVAVGTAGNGNGVGPFGHSDLAGNVWEWTRDLAEYYSSATVPPVDPLNPFNPVNGYPVSRGGSWWPGDTKDQFTTYHRFVWYPTGPNVSFGARCARDVPKSPPLGDASADSGRR